MSCFILDVMASMGSSGSGNPYSLLFMLVVFLFIFYFLVLRPQQKRNKSHRELINSISKGDEVLTSGGIVGRVIKLTEIGYIVININDNNNHEVIVKRDCVTALLPKGTMKSL